MIVTFLLTILFAVISVPLSVLPNSMGLPLDIGNALAYFAVQISSWTFIFPMSTVMTILGYTLLVEFSLWTYHGFIWSYNKIRGI